MAAILMEEIKKDPDLRRFTLDRLPLLKTLKKRCLETPVAVCIERAQSITAYMKKTEGSGEPMELRRAKAIAGYLESRAPVFPNHNLLAGTSTAKEYGAPVYPELLGIGIWPELDTISKRKTNPQLLTPTEAEILNFEVFPYWLDRTVLEKTREKLTKEQSPSLMALELMEKIAFFMGGKTTVISHTTPYYEEVLHKGLLAMSAGARQQEEKLKSGASANDPGTREKVVFYQALQIAMKGIMGYAKNLAAKAAELAETAGSAEEKNHYRDMANVCARVPAYPADTFREAVNSLWLCHVAILAENVNMALNPGRLDQILYPFFKKDVEQNKLTIEQALTLTGCLWFKIADNTNLVPESAERLFGGAGSVPAVTLGGIDQDGNDAVNDLTYLMLRVTELLMIKDPNVNARFHNEINDKIYRDRVSRVIMNTRAIPAVYNDVRNIATLENQGVSTPHARDYAVVGCVELNSAGREYASTSAILLNLSAAMDMTLYNGKRPYITGDRQIGPVTGKPGDLKTFADFRAAFAAQLRALVEMAVALNEELGKMHQQLLPSPLLSCFFAGPMEKGRDLIYGGALYNSSGATHVAFADVCDSLNAVEDAVYLNRITTLPQLKEALEKNFVGFDDLLAYLKNKAPKYGMDDAGEEHPGTVKNSQWLVRFLYDLYQSHTNYRGGKYRPAYWTMTNHAGLGTIGMALPSGRKAGEAFSSGITPASQCAKDLTGVYKSVGQLDSLYIPGGVALNMKYTPEPISRAKETYIDHFGDMLEGYFNSGGMQVQFNIRTYETLLDAQRRPDKYPGLIVRVSGYSAYFEDLNDAMKHELITRTQYDLYSGKAEPFPDGFINKT